MQIFSRHSRRLAALTAATATLFVAACGDSTVAPQLPGNPPIPPQYRGQAFILDVSPSRGTVRITAPSSTLSLGEAQGNLNVGDEATFSLLGGDAIDLTSANFVAGAVGASVPNKVLVTFDLTVNNKLPGIQLGTPTFPTPPAGTVGAVAFPFEISVVTTSGGVSSSNNEIIVESPRYGAVASSNNWDNADHNFFSGGGCTLSSTDCFRSEAFGVIDPLGASLTKNVGFLIDPTVGDFRVKVILAADLVVTATPTPGTVQGSVTSPQIGAISGANVSVSGGFAGVTNGAGAYSIPGVATGSRTVSVSNLPAGCTAPASQNATVTSGGTAVVNFSVTCTVPTGTISGTISSSLGGGISGAQVVVTPTGGSALPGVATSGAGAYSVGGVPTIPPTGSITLANLPAGCTNPGATPYSGLTTGGLTVNITVTCVAAPFSYPFSAAWGAITNTGPTGRQVTLEFSINMGGAPGRPDVNGAAADDLAGISFNVGYNGVGLDYTVRTLTDPTGSLDLGIVNETNAGTASAQAAVAVASTGGLTVSGSTSIIRLTFNIATGFSGTINPSVVVTEALATTGLINVTSSVAVQALPALIIP
ncbi:MAG TPA: carboxypeptidase-like regulatory domain-containing protein [Gemmatimonadaceae bacterium]|nr:carboxypeptidase-like regulatory domain-containing protein [Gemmatimonadaceae bacterium]